MEAVDDVQEALVSREDRQRAIQKIGNGKVRSDRAGASITRRLVIGHKNVVNVAGVAELVDAPDSKSGFFGSASSILALGTKHLSAYKPCKCELNNSPVNTGFFP